jgi:SAM-dependent methyltransferase
VRRLTGGWRQNFKNAGFPGIDAEFAEVSEFFAPANGGTVVDMSCGSGLMTRRLVTSGAYERVLALDYSESMLRETARRIAEERVPTDALTLCRADVAALPLRPGSIDAMHAGAAMHCWPRLEEGLKQIKEALKPDGGRFFASTFLQGAYGAAMPAQTGGANSFRFFTLEELEQVAPAASPAPPPVALTLTLTLGRRKVSVLQRQPQHSRDVPRCAKQRRACPSAFVLESLPCCLRLPCCRRLTCCGHLVCRAQLLLDAGFPKEGLSVRREGQGCALIRAELIAPAAGAADAVRDETLDAAASVDEAVEAADVAVAEMAAAVAAAEMAAAVADAEVAAAAAEEAVAAATDAAEELAVAEAAAAEPDSDDDGDAIAEAIEKLE